MKQRTITPVDGSVYVERELAAEETIEKALATAVRAQTDWKGCPVLERVKIVRRMVEWCVARAEELGAELSWQMGRPLAQSPNEIRRGFQERALYLCGIAEEALADLGVGEKEGVERVLR